MWKWFIGPALVGTGWLTGSVYGRDAEQLAHKSPEETYAAVEQALADLPESGTTSFEGGTPMPYRIDLDRTPERQLVIKVSFAGQPGAEAKLDFAPQDRGKATLISIRVHGDHEVLRQVLAGTSRARLAYAPD